MSGPVQNPMRESKTKTQGSTTAKAAAKPWHCCGFAQAADAMSCVECGSPRMVVGEMIVGETKTEIGSKVSTIYIF